MFKTAKEFPDVMKQLRSSSFTNVEVHSTKYNTKKTTFNNHCTKKPLPTKRRIATAQLFVLEVRRERGQRSNRGNGRWVK